MRSVNKTLAGAGVLLCSIALALGSSPLPAGASISQSKVVSANPADNTPQIVLGVSPDQTAFTVYAFAQVGSIMYAGGLFDQAKGPGGTVTRHNFFAFNASTGAITSLHLSFDGPVHTLVPSSDGKALYIGGSFKTIDGIARKAIVKYDLVNNRIDTTFNAPTAGGTVLDAKLVGSRLIVGGTLTKSLLALDPNTGADTGYINLAISGVTNPKDITKILRFAVNPARTRLVAIGNFATINGSARRWAFELSLGSTATLTTWHGARLDVACANINLNVAQGVDFSPDGSYFVIVTTGSASGSGGLCDAAGRYETSNLAGTAGATWVNFTGGDSLYSVSATGAAVYVAGHARWLDNPLGHNSAGPGAVVRTGIGAIDPVSGKANSWNPTKDRGHGTEALYATSSGLWVGSDTAVFAGETHAGIAFCPLSK